MNTESLKTFVVLADTKNFTRTARQLFIAQSTVTNRINELETEINVTLFSRNNRSVALTREGELFLLYAKKMLELTNSSLAEISSAHKFKNHLRIGASDSIYETHLAEHILNYQHNHPEDSLKITIGLSANLLEQLQNNILDVVFSYLPLRKPDLHCEIYKQDSMVLVTDSKNRKYVNGITKNQLLNENYLMCNFALQDVGQFIRALFPKYHQFSLEIDDCSKILPFLSGNDSYTFLPKDMARSFVDSKELAIIPLLDFETPVINSYITGKKSKEKIWREIFL